MRTSIFEPPDPPGFDNGERIFFEGGKLDIIEPERYGMLRSPDHSCIPGLGDLYVCPFLIMRYGLRAGDRIDGFVQRPLQTVVVDVLRINGDFATECHL